MIYILYNAHAHDENLVEQVRLQPHIPSRNLLTKDQSNHEDYKWSDVDNDVIEAAPPDTELEPEVPTFHLVNRRLWKKRKWVWAGVILGIPLIFLITLCFAVCFRCCLDIFYQVYVTLATPVYFCMGRDENYLHACHNYWRLGLARPTYEHYLKQKDAYSTIAQQQ